MSSVQNVVNIVTKCVEQWTYKNVVAVKCGNTNRAPPQCAKYVTIHVAAMTRAVDKITVYSGQAINQTKTRRLLLRTSRSQI